MLTTLALLPALLLLFMFDARDRLPLQSPAPQGWRAVLTSAIASSVPGQPSPDRALSMRLMIRVGTSFALIAAVGSLLAQVPPLISILLLAITAAVLFSRRANIVGDVIMAVEGTESFHEASNRVAAAVNSAAIHTDRMVVVGHSQGGYLAHDLLSQRRINRNLAAFYGLGSGLKPISILRWLMDGRRLLTAWLVLLYLVAVPIVVVRSVDFTPTGAIELLRSALVLILSATLLPLRSEALLREWADEMAGIPLLDLPRVTDPTLLAGGAILGVLAIWAIRRSFRGPGFNLRLAPIASQAWTEVSTHQDLVGRLLVPALPEDAKELVVTLGGNPLLDHVSYFRPGSPVPTLLAERCLSLLPIEEYRRIRVVEAIDTLRALSERRRRLRYLVIAVPLVVGLLILLLMGRGLLLSVEALAVPTALLVIISGHFLRGRELNRQAAALHFLAQDMGAVTARHERSLTPGTWRTTLVIGSSTLGAITLALTLPAQVTHLGTGIPAFALTLLAIAGLTTVALAQAAGYRPNMGKALIGLAIVAALSVAAWMAFIVIHDLPLIVALLAGAGSLVLTTYLMVGAAWLPEALKARRGHARRWG